MLSFYIAMLDDEADKVKLEKIYEKYKAVMLNTAMRFTGHQYYAEEAVSKALYRITTSIEKIDDSSEKALCSYIYTVVKNVSIDVLKEKEKDSKLLNIDELYYVSSDYDVAKEVEQRENYSALLAKINDLPEMYKSILVLRYVNNMSAMDIAKILNVSVHTVNTRLKRGKVKLRAIIGEEDDNDE